LKPEILIALTAPSGIALDGSKGATLLERAQMAAWFKPGRGGRDGSVRWSSNKSTRSSKPATWSLAECALACAGLPDHIHLALRFSFARDDAALWPLRNHLTAFAAARQRIEGWSKTVHTLGVAKQMPYLTRLVDMALLEERQPARFKGGDGTMGHPQNLRPILMGVNRDLWRRHLAKPYEAIRDEYLAWVGIGLARMRKALRDEGAHCR